MDEEMGSSQVIAQNLMTIRNELLHSLLECDAFPFLALASSFQGKVDRRLQIGDNVDILVLLRGEHLELGVPFVFPFIVRRSPLQLLLGIDQFLLERSQRLFVVVL